MAFRRWGTSLALGALLVGNACGGAFSSSGDGDGGDGDGDGDTGGDGDDPNPGDGDGDGIEGQCERDTDCLGVWVTSAACYSGNCSGPVAASSDDVESDPCLVPWTADGAPQATEACQYDSEDPVACLLACAQQPACIVPSCSDSGRCEIRLLYDQTECGSTGTGGSGNGTGGGSNEDCSTLDATREEALDKARSCLADGVIAECVVPTSVSDECGCPVAVNSHNPSDIESAQAAYNKWNDSCEPPDYCQSIDCQSATNTTVCQPESMGASTGVCAFE